MSDHFPHLKPSTTLLTPAEMALWQDADTAYRTALQDAHTLRANAQAAHAAERQRGYAEGRAHAATEMADHILKTTDMAARMIRDIETGLPDIVADVIEDMLGQVDLDEVLPIAITHGLSRIRRGASAHLRIAADCAAPLRHLSDDLNATDSLIRIEIDPALSPGRCVLESEFGTAELGLDAQIRVLRERLNARWQETDTPPDLHDSQTA